MSLLQQFTAGNDTKTQMTVAVKIINWKEKL